MVTLWRERHGLCKSHFVERNWYMFPAKIYPAEIFPRLCRPNILELCRRIKNQNSKSRRPPLTPPHPLLTTQRCSAACQRHPNSACGRPNAPQWHPAEAILCCRAIVKKTTRKSPQRLASNHLHPSLLRRPPINLTQSTLYHRCHP